MTSDVVGGELPEHEKPEHHMKFEFIFVYECTGTLALKVLMAAKMQNCKIQGLCKVGD
jgi:hypothetical protein